MQEGRDAECLFMRESSKYRSERKLSCVFGIYRRGDSCVRDLEFFSFSFFLGYINPLSRDNYDPTALQYIN